MQIRITLNIESEDLKLLALVPTLVDDPSYPDWNLIDTWFLKMIQEETDLYCTDQIMVFDHSPDLPKNRAPMDGLWDYARQNYGVLEQLADI